MSSNWTLSSPSSVPQYPVTEYYKQMSVQSTSSTPSLNKVDAMLPKKHGVITLLLQSANSKCMPQGNIYS